MFQTNDYVFYGSGGICKIADICSAPLEGMPRDRVYYVMHSIHDRNGVIYVPVDSEGVFLRRLLNREEAQMLLERIPEILVIEAADTKLLRARYMEAMRSHDPAEWVRVIKTVHLRMQTLESRTARLTETERSFLDSAKRYLYAELSLALGLSEADVESQVTCRMQGIA